MHIYLARPIDRAVHLQNLQRQVDEVCTLLLEAGHTTYQPYRAWSTNKIDGSTIQNVNQYALIQCDAVVAFMPAGVYSIGVPMEVQFAIDHGKDVVIVTDMAVSSSAMLSYLRSTHAVPIVSEAKLVEPALRHRKDSRSTTGHSKLAKWCGEGRSPKAGKDGDAGFDLYYSDSESITIPPGGFANVRSKIAVELPDDMWFMILGRSSSFSRRIFVAPSVIDAGYRGELFACCWNISGVEQLIEPDERIAQIVPFELTAKGIQWIRTELSQTERGDTGFGSTGL